METNSDRPESEAVESRLRLKRVFLLSLIFSLAACALIAVGVLLFGQFGSVTARILGTLGVLAVHSGAALACADSLERRLWPVLSRIGLAVFTLNFAWFELIIWGHDTWAFEETITTLTLLGFYVLAIPPCALYAKRRWRPLAIGGFAMCAVSLLMTLAVVWFEYELGDDWQRCAAALAILAISMSHTCLLGFVKPRGAINWVLRGTITSIWLLAVLICVAILLDSDDELLVRFMGALGVLDGCGNLSLLILTRLNKVQAVERLETSEKQIELICPRCTKQQKLTSGAAECVDCGLRFRIEIEEPRCPGCGYLLWQLPERRCPECGQEF